MQQLADDILAIIGDYQNDFGVQLTTQNIIDWANQFDEVDREFVLQEFLHLLDHGIYVSKDQAIELLNQSLQALSRHFNYPNVQEFLRETLFLNLQPAPKSQGEILSILDDLIQANYGITLNDCGRLVQQNYVYYDDLLATGGTISRITGSWLGAEHSNGNSNFELINSGRINFVICLFCCHTWGLSTCRWLWKYNLGNDEIMKKVKVAHHYSVENQIGIPSEKLNLAYPIGRQSNLVGDFLRTIESTRHEAKAFRRIDQPKEESFFSNPENRIRFENILLEKGIEILNRVQIPNRAHRPLGATFPSYKTLGTGTLFFTWRNISNTCPLVFWWRGHGWHGLFPLRNRGGN